MHHFIAIGQLKLESQSKKAKFGQNQQFFVLCDLEIWPMTFTNNRTPLLCYIRVCASFHSLQSIQAGVTVRKHPIRVKIDDFFVQCHLQIWQMTLKNNRAPYLTYFKLCASFHSHWSIQTGVKVWKSQIWVKISDFFCPVSPWNLTDDFGKQ